ncbi:MAG: hypothetical protein ACOYXT_27415 [Bacteroidota bacterium]
MHNEREEHYTLSIALFCAAIVCCLDLAYVLMRKGFPIDYQSLLTLNGISFFLLFMPAFAFRFFPGIKANKLFFGPIGLTIYGVLGMSLLGYVLRDYAVYAALIFAAAGFLFFLYALWLFARGFNLSRLGFFLIAVFLGAWVVGKIWGLFALHPLFTEALALLSQNDLLYIHDTVFHASFSQMLKTYSIPSTGLDGLPSMYYHYGSHWILGQLSTFTGTDVLTIYNVGYPVIFIPLFFYAFINLAIEMQQFLCGRIVVNGFFWLAVFVFFLPIPKGGYSLGLLGVSLLVNESQTISMVFLFFLLSICIDLENAFKRSKIFLCIVIPATILILGFLKISTAFIASALIGFLFLRYQGFKNTWLLVSMALCAGGFMLAYFYTAETIPFVRTASYEGQFFERFHFYKHTHPFNAFHWFVWFYFWTYLAVALNIIYRKQIIKQYTAFRWSITETVLVVAIVGVLPSIFMVFSGGNSMYFSNIQLYVAGVICLGFYPFAADKIEKLFSHSRRVLVRAGAFVIIAAIVILGWREVRRDVKMMIRKSVQVRYAAAGKDYKELEKLSITDPRIGEAYKIEAAKLIQSNPAFQFLQNLTALNEIPLAEKKKTLLYKPCACDREISFDQNCVVVAHMAPAFSGLAMIDGIPAECSIGIYGGLSYPDLSTSSEKKLTTTEAKEWAEKEGFSRILYYDCEQRKYTGKIPACKEN